MTFDLLIKGATVVDPSQQLNAAMDLAVGEGKIGALAPDLSSASAERTIDGSGLIVTPGLIDLHTHVYWGASPLSIDPGQIWLQGGTTTIVDAGTAGAHTFAAFRKFIIEPSPHRILAFLNISAIGLAAFRLVGEATQIKFCNVAKAVQTVDENRDVIVGLKTRASGDVVGDNGMAPVELALAAADRVGLPLMVHVAYTPSVMAHILPLLRKGDILTHCYTEMGDPRGGDTILDPEDQIRQVVWDARRRGVLFDIGHGVSSFSYRVSRTALAQGFEPDSISTDVHALSFPQSISDMSIAMSKLLNLGMSLEHVVACATMRPAEMIGQDRHLGTLRLGAVGDLAIFKLQRGDFHLEDTCGRQMAATQLLVPVFTVHSGQLMPPTNRKMGPRR